MRARGHSLLETVIALFVLASAALVVVALYHSALVRTSQTQQAALARVIAERVMVETRSLAAKNPFRVVDPSTLSRTFTDPDHPTFEVTVAAARQVLTNPASALQPPTPPQVFPLMSDVASVEVTVSWAGGAEQFRLNSLLDEGEVPLVSVRVEGSLGPISGNQRATYEAKAFDANGDIVPDVRFIWWVEPITGNASIVPASLDPKAELTNVTRSFDGSFYVQPGACRVAALARVRGKEVVGYSGEITLAP